MLQEQHSGSMFMVKVGPNFSRIRKNFETHILKWSAVIDKTVDLFMRVNTDQAEIIATVLAKYYSPHGFPIVLSVGFSCLLLIVILV